MTMRRRWTIDGRSDSRLAVTGGGWVSATPSLLTRWHDDVAASTVRIPDASPGPLASLRTEAGSNGAIGWGVQVMDGDTPRWSVRDIAAVALADVGGVTRPYRLAIGAVDGSGSLAFAAFQRPQPRTRGSSALKKTTVLVIVEVESQTCVEVIDGPVPSEVLWGAGPLVLGRIGHIEIRSDRGEWTRHDLGEQTAPRSFARAGDRLWVGSASGTLTRVELGSGGVVTADPAHSLPVTALAAATELVASGDSNGLIRLWQDGTLLDETAEPGPVAALEFLPGSGLLAKIGGSEGLVTLIEL